MARRRIGIFGGTFDPVHFGHLRAAQEVAEAHDLAVVHLVPNRIPPHRKPGPAASPEARLAMVTLAVRGNRRLAVSDFEVAREGPSFTLLTLQHFREETRGRADILFILGTDAFAEVGTWHRAEEVLGLADFIVMTRPGTRLPRLVSALPRRLARQFEPLEECRGACEGVAWRHISGRVFRPTPVTHLAISASDIRRRVALGLSIRYLTPDPVADYIRRRGLYRPAR